VGQFYSRMGGDEMKKRIIAFVSVITVLFVYICALMGCTPKFLPKAEKLRYVEYVDQNGKIYAKGVYGDTPWYGYIVLNGKKVPACFKRAFPTTDILVTIPEKDIPQEFKKSEYRRFGLKDLNEQNQLVSYRDDVVLYGENFGQIVLTMNQLDKDDFEVWELPWKIQIVENWNLVLLTIADLYSYETNDKCVSMYVRKRQGYNTEYFIFRWLPDSNGFEIFEAEENQVKPAEDQQPIATGTYVLQEEVVTLTFVTDGVFNGAYPTLMLTLNV